jgi:hypothetical protein
MPIFNKKWFLRFWRSPRVGLSTLSSGAEPQPQKDAVAIPNANKKDFPKREVFFYLQNPLTTILNTEHLILNT